MSPTNPTNLPSWVCLHCQEAELAAVPGSPWWACPNCGHGFHQVDLAAYYSPARVAARATQAARREEGADLQACWEEQTRRRGRGGGNDGLSMVRDIPWSDDSIDRATAHKSDRTRVLRIKGLDAKTPELQRALQRLLTEQ